MTSATTSATSTAVLALEHVCAGYGPYRALFDVSFDIGEGRAVAVLGPNGAGKTTVARVCSGLVTPESGTLRLRGEDVSGAPAWRIAREGIAHAPEGRSVFATLTVEENLTLALRAALGRDAVGSGLDEAFGRFPRLGERRRQMAGTLSGGEQRMLALARVLTTRPRLLVVDELSLGLAPIVVDEVYHTLAEIKASGTALLVIEQHLDHALGIADEAVLMSRGHVTFVGPASAVDVTGVLTVPSEGPPDVMEDQHPAPQ